MQTEPLDDHMQTVSVLDNLHLAENIGHISMDTSAGASDELRQQGQSSVQVPNGGDAEQVAFDGIASAVTTLGDSVVQLSVALQELRKLSTTRK